MDNTRMKLINIKPVYYIFIFTDDYIVSSSCIPENMYCYSLPTARQEPVSTSSSLNLVVNIYNCDENVRIIVINLF